MRPPSRLCLMLVLWSTAALGREIFVDNRSGDNRSTGQQLQNTAQQIGPVRTLAEALRLAGSGDAIVLVNAGLPYRESISLVGSQFQRKPATAVCHPRQRRDPGRFAPVSGGGLEKLSRAPCSISVRG